MKKKIPLLVLAILALGAVAFAAQQRPVPVALEFGTSAPDEEIIALLRSHNARPYVLYLWAGGETSGIHHTPPDTELEEAFAEARQKTQEGSAQMLQSASEDLKAFVNEHPRETFLASAELQEQGRTRLLRFEEQKAILQRSAAQQEPFVYGAEVLVDRNGVRALAADPVVVRSKVGTWLAGKPVVDRPSTPRAELKSLGANIAPAELYAKINEAASYNMENIRHEF